MRNKEVLLAQRKRLQIKRRMPLNNTFSRGVWGLSPPDQVESFYVIRFYQLLRIRRRFATNNVDALAADNGLAFDFYQKLNGQH